MNSGGGGAPTRGKIFSRRAGVGPGPPPGSASDYSGTSISTKAVCIHFWEA